MSLGRAVHAAAMVRSSLLRRTAGLASPLHLSLGGTRGHCDEPLAPNAASVKITYVNKDGSKKEVVGKEGQNLLHLAHENEIDLEGACECSCACSTCHVILEDKVYRDLEPATDEEEDLLDLAFGLTSTSRLGCQVKITKEFEGTQVTLPAATRNFYVDGHKPKPH